MSAFAAPFHFVATFMMAVGAFACVWLAVSRPESAPRGWTRFVFGAGWAFLGVAETVHGAQFVQGDSLTAVLALRTIAYFLLLVALLFPVSPSPGEPGFRRPGMRQNSAAGRPVPSSGWMPPEGRRGRFWGVTATTVTRTAGPAALALMAALFALRSRLDGARRLALALGLLGASEIFLARSGTSTTLDATWVVGHGLHLLAGLALGFWLWRAFRVSVQARIVASLVLLLIIVIATISATVTNAFARNVREDAFRTEAAQVMFEGTRFAEQANSMQTVAGLMGLVTKPYVAANNKAAVEEIFNTLFKSQQPPTSTVGVDFVFALTPQAACQGQPQCGGTILGSAVAAVNGQSAVNDLEGLVIAGSPEARWALQGVQTASVDDIGASKSKLAVMGAVPVWSGPPSSSPVIGAVVAGRIVNKNFLESLPLPGKVPVTVIGANGELLGSSLDRGADKLLAEQQSDILARAIQQGGVVRKEATVGSKSYYVVTGPLLRSDGKRVGAVMISQEQTLAATQEQVAKTIFLGALAATLFAVGAASISGSRITRPIRELTYAAEQVRRGDLKARVPVAEADEVGLLGEAFNQMTTSLETQAADLREATLQEIQLRGELETILQSMTDGLIAVDRTGRIVTVNREAERITGVPADRARERKVERVLAVVDSSGEHVELPVYRMAGGSAAGFIAGNPTAGQGIPVAVTSAPITDDDGTITGAVAVLRDLTSELEVETMKTEFLSNISHELRTPLTPIKGYADLLRRKVVPRAKAISFLNVIVASTERMERIVDMLVDFSAMQAGRLMVRTGPFNLDRATADLVSKWEESAPKHFFERTGFESLPSVAGDPRLLPRAIDELIDNAVKFSPDGGPISIHGEIDGQRPSRVRVSVTDHGIGITAEQMSQIFQDFVQVDASETRAFGGLGLGLGYVRRIIEAHEGELQVESAPGEGSRFSLLIPMQRTGDFGGVRSVHNETAPIPVIPIRRRGMGTRKPPPEWHGDR
jgi:PAS domain S-box-containing protein